MSAYPSDVMKSAPISLLGLDYGAKMSAGQLYQLVFARIPDVKAVCAFKTNCKTHEVWSICASPPNENRYRLAAPDNLDCLRKVFNNEKTQKDTKFYIGVVALTDGMAREFVIWSNWFLRPIRPICCSCPVRMGSAGISPRQAFRVFRGQKKRF